VRAAITICAACLACALAGCGGGSSHGSTKNHPTLTTAPAQPASGSQSCLSKHMGATTHNQGVCTLASGLRFYFVNRTTKLVLPQLAVKLNSVSETKTIGSGRSATTAKGMYVVVQLTVTNRTSGAVPFDGAHNQTLLITSKQAFTEDAASQHEPRSFAQEAKTPIPAGGSLSGSLVYDVTSSELKAVRQSGVLTVLQFTDAGVNISRKPQSVVGALRLGH
jgi:Domain of unknown function (DUF4352)